MTIILINNVEFKTIFVKKFKKLYFTDFFLKSASPFFSLVHTWAFSPYLSGQILVI